MSAWVDELLDKVPPLVPEELAARLVMEALARRRRIVLFPRCDLAAVLEAIGAGEES